MGTVVIIGVVIFFLIYTDKQFFYLTLKIQKVMSNTEIVLAKIAEYKAQLAKIAAEVQALKALVGSTPDTPQVIVDAVNDLQPTIQGIDDINPDAVV